MARIAGVDIPTEEESSPIASIVNGDGRSSIRYLNRLRRDSIADLAGIVSTISARLGLVSETSSKKSSTAKKKCVRPATLSKYPWFRLCHLRDYLRFRTRLNDADDFATMLHLFEQLRVAGLISIVKIDLDKLRRASPFGWRMVATDLRIASTGLMVEHYMTFSDMISVNEEWLHKVYEKWRDRPTPALLAEAADRDRDAEFSSVAYRELMLTGITQAPGPMALATQRTANENATIGALTARF